MSSDENAGRAARQAVWSRYWQGQTGASGAGSFQGGYAGSAIGRWWHEVFSHLPDGARWLDVASGNGALPQLWLQTSAARTGQCDAIDLATAPPAWLSEPPSGVATRVRWHAAQGAESLPFPDASMALVASQYGFEYTEIPSSLAEALRVLAPGGALRLVLHDTAARPAQLAQLELKYQDLLLSKGGLFEASCEMIEPYARSATAEGRMALAQDSKANALREGFNAAEQALRRAMPAQQMPELHDECVHALAGVFRCAVAQGPRAAEALADTWKAQLLDHRFRLAELLRCALPPGSLASMAAHLQARGLAARHGPLYDGPHLMGVWLAAERQSA